MKALRMSSRNGSLWHVLNLPVFVPFLRLPAEIRNSIYQHALRLDDTCYLREGGGLPRTGAIVHLQDYPTGSDRDLLLGEYV